MPRRSRTHRESTAPAAAPERRRARRKPRSLLNGWEALEGRWCPSQGTVVPGTAQATLGAYGQLPLAFEPNRGQADRTADYVAHGDGYTLRLSRGDAVLDLGTTAASSVGAAAPDVVLRMHLAGAGVPASPQGLDSLPGKSDYFLGNNPSGWLTGIDQYARVAYHDVYPGINVVYHGTNAHQLEYDFDLAAGADPGAIGIAFDGASRVTIDDEGGLTLEVGGFELKQPVPVASQDIGGGRVNVSVRYVLTGPGQVGFEVGPHDPTRPLVIDPALLYSTYLGGVGADVGTGIAVDESSSAYIVGTTTSLDYNPGGSSPSGYPGPPQVFDEAGVEEAFVAKLSPDGSSLVYSAYYGGTFLSGTTPGGATEGRGIAVDSSGNAYFTGMVEAADLPLIAPLDEGRELGGSSAQNPPAGGDAFVAALNPDGTALVFSTYLGGSNADEGTGIAVGATGDLFVVGSTSSYSDVLHPGDTGFPVTQGAAQGTYGGNEAVNGGTYGVTLEGDAFVARLHFQPKTNATDPRLSLVYSTYLGGWADESGRGIALDGQDNSYITGYTDTSNDPSLMRTDFPTKGAFQSGNNSLSVFFGQVPLPDAFVAKFDPAGALVYSSFLGGGAQDIGAAIAVDASGRAYVAGYTNSSAIPGIGELPFPTSSSAAQGSLAGNPQGALSDPYDAFLTIVSADGSSLVYSSYYGGDDDDEGWDVGLDAIGDIFLAGSTQSIDLPGQKSGQGGLQGPSDGFVTRFGLSEPLGGPATATTDAATYLGGSGSDFIYGLAVDPLGSAYVTGNTSSADFPLLFPVEGSNAGGAGSDSYLDFGFALDPGDAFVTRLPGLVSGILGLPISATKGQAFSGPVAFFSPSDSNRSASDFSATIDWGDGTTSDGILTPAPGSVGRFTVLGNHRYANAGGYPVVVTVRDNVLHDDITADVDITKLPHNQSEENIAIDPNSPLHLFAVSNREVGTGAGLIGAYSLDGGLTWAVQPMADGHDGLPDACCDPQLAWDSFDNLFLTYVTDDDDHVEVVVSRDGGRQFQEVAQFAAPSGGSVDQPTIAVGPGADPQSGSVWISFNDQGSTRLVTAGARVNAQGAVGAFQPATSITPQGIPGSPNFGSLAIGPHGQVVVDWESATSQTGPEDVSISLDPDGLGPLPFAPPSPNADSGKTQHVVHSGVGFGVTGVANPLRGFDVEANLAWDRINRNRIYMSYADRPDKPGSLEDTIIRLVFSDDDGKTWSDPVQVSHSAASTQFLPCIAVDPLNGDVAVGWYDTAGDSTHGKTHFHVAISTDGGVTFVSDQVIASGASYAGDPSLTVQGKKFGYGDFSSLAFEFGVVNPAWADNSPALPGNPDPHQFDVATAAIGVARVADAPIQVISLPVNTVEGQEFDGDVAFVPDPNPALPSGNYTATIDWGDGGAVPDITPGGIDEIRNGTQAQIFIKGGHTYQQAGSYPVVVMVHDATLGADSTSATNLSAIEGSQVGGVIASDPSDPARYFAASDTESVQGLFASVTFNSGAAWTTVGQTDNLIADGTDGLPIAVGDPAAVYDLYGNLFLAYVDQSLGSVVVVLSTDGGLTFRQTPVAVLSTGAVGRPVLAVSDGAYPGASGSVWVAYYDFQTGTVQAVGASVQGKGQIGSFMVPEAVPDSAGVGEDLDISVGDHGEVLVAFARLDAAGEYVVDTSLDADALGPGGFAKPVLVAQTNVAAGTKIPALGSSSLEVVPRLAWAHDGPKKGTVYVGYNVLTYDKSHVGVVAQPSSDSGKTWNSSDLRLVGVSTSDAFLPAIAVDRSTGDIGVAWYETNDPAAPQRVRVFAAVSSDGGNSYHNSTAVDFGPTDATDSGLNPYGQSTRFGGPVGLGFNGGLLIPAWSDDSKTLPGNPDRPQFELAAASVVAAHVADAPLTTPQLGDLTVKAFKGHPFQGVVATFTDANPFADAKDFTVTIDWGDSNFEDSNGHVEPSGNGGFQVIGEHTFNQDAGFSKFQIQVTIKDKGGSLALSDSNLQLDDPLDASGLPLKEYKDRPFQTVVGGFSDFDPNLPADDFAATIDWSDGTTSAGTIAAGGFRGTFVVSNSQAKTFDEAGNYDAEMTITAKNGDTAQALITINVADELKVVVKNPIAYAGSDFSGTVASLSDADPAAAYDQYEVPQIDWGDGSPTDSGVIIADPGTTGFLVVGAHAYTTPGQYPVTVTVVRRDGPQATGGGTAFVQPPKLSGQGTNLPSLGFQGISTDASGSFNVQGPAAPEDYHGTIDWGDGSAPVEGTITVDGTTITVDASHAYAQPGQHTATITLDGPFGITDSQTADVDVAADVSAQVEAVASGLIYNPQTQLFNGSITLTNVGASPLDGPILDIVLAGLPAGVQLVGAAGSTPAGDPYITDDLNLNPIGPGQSLPPLPIQFSDLSLQPISYMAVVFSDPPAWYESALAGLALSGGAGRKNAPVPIGFQPNRGQANASVQFVASTSSSSLGLLADGALLAAPVGWETGATSSVQLRLVGARDGVPARALDLEAGTLNVLFGSDPSAWLTGIPTYGQVVYAGVYPGVDLVYRTGRDGLEYDFVVAPGANPSAIGIAASGADSVGLNPQGDLVLHTTGDFLERAPVLYQKSGDHVRPVSGGFSIDTDGRIGFRVGAYNPALPLVIDPVLGFSTFFGGLGNEDAYGVAVDPAGNSYLAGSVDDYSYQTLPLKDPFQGTTGGTKAGFVAKFDPDGNLVYSTLLGGDRITEAFGIAVDATGHVYVTGRTEAGNFPVKDPIQSTLGKPEGPPGIGGPGDAFLTKLSPDGSSLVYSTYLGGQANEQANAVALDAASDVFVVGLTGSQDFPIANPLQPHLRLNSFNQPTLDAFVANVNSSGTALIYSTYLGGSGDDVATGIAVDAAGDAYLTGTAGGGHFSGFPTAGNGNLPGNFMNGTAFISELSPDGSTLLFSTPFGGGQENDSQYLFRPPGAIALDPAGNIYVAGETMSRFFLTTSNAFQPDPGPANGAGFLVKLSADDRLIYSTYLRGTSSINSQPYGTVVYGLTTDASGDAYVVGDTLNRDFPTKDAVQPVHGDDQGQRDAFLTEFDATGSALVASTYLGGSHLDDWSGDDYALGVAVDAARGRIYVAGGTRSPDFPTTSAAFQTKEGGTNVVGSYDAFLVRVDGPGPTLDLGTEVPPIAATEGIPFQALVATFSDPRPGAADGDFTATIDWGDGTTSTGTIVADPTQPASFLVRGAHTYEEDQDESVTVTVARADGSGSSAPASGKAIVADAPLVAVGASVVAVEGRAFHGRVASFLDASPFDFASSFTATIDWGDGSTSDGTIRADDPYSGQFAVEGSHTYSEEGAYPIRVAIQDRGGSTATATGTVAATATAGQITYHVVLDTQGLSSGPAILRFQLNPGAIPGTQAATANVAFDPATGGSFDPVALANGTQLNEADESLVGISGLSFDLTLGGDAVGQPGGGRFGTTFAVQLLAGDRVTPLGTSDPSGAVFIVDLNPDGAASARSLSLDAGSARPAVMARNVADAPLSATGTSRDASTGESVTAVVARFDDADPSSTVDDFRATIDWGDGTSSPGSVVLDQGGSARFDVVGTHSYARTGHFVAAVAIADRGGSTATQTATIVVNDATSGGSGSATGGPESALVGVRRLGLHNQPTRLVLTLNGPLDPARAIDLANYQVVAAGRDGILGDRDDALVPVARVIYQPKLQTITLRLARRINIHHRYRLTVRDLNSNGVTGQADHPLDGASAGRNGGDVSVVVTWKDVVLPKPGGKGIVGLERLKHIVWPRSRRS